VRSFGRRQKGKKRFYYYLFLDLSLQGTSGDPLAEGKEEEGATV